MARFFDCAVDTDLLTGMRLARAAIGRGDLVVMPTDTVYGIAADAFQPRPSSACSTRRAAARTSPPPVLVAGIPTLDALAESCPTPSARSSTASGPAASRRSCPRSPPSPGTSARPAAPSRSACPTTASPSSCSPRPARSPSARQPHRPARRADRPGGARPARRRRRRLPRQRRTPGRERPPPSSTPPRSATAPARSASSARASSRREHLQVVGDARGVSQRHGQEPEAAPVAPTTPPTSSRPDRRATSRRRPTEQPAHAEPDVRAGADEPATHRAPRARPSTRDHSSWLVAAVVTFVLSLVIWRLGMRYRLYPKIRERDVHTRPTPRLGGIAMFIGRARRASARLADPLLPPRLRRPEQIIAILGARLSSS